MQSTIFTFSRKVQNQCRHQWRQNQLSLLLTFILVREKFKINIVINWSKTKYPINNFYFFEKSSKSMSSSMEAKPKIYVVNFLQNLPNMSKTGPSWRWPQWFRGVRMILRFKDRLKTLDIGLEVGWTEIINVSVINVVTIIILHMQVKII
jgi:hypothetical protein